MIKTFFDKETEEFFQGKFIKKWQSFYRQAEKRMQILDSATCLEDLRNLPSNRLEALSGNRKGQFSIRINLQWRICFRWVDNEPHDVQIVDYH